MLPKVAVATCVKVNPAEFESVNVASAVAVATTKATRRSFNAGVKAPLVFGVAPVSAVPISCVQVAIAY